MTEEKVPREEPTQPSLRYDYELPRKTQTPISPVPEDPESLTYVETRPTMKQIAAHEIVERVRRVRIEVPELARIIEVSSVEDHKGRGWGAPRATIEGPGGSADTSITASEVAPLAQALRDAFAAFERAFGA